MEWTTVLEMIVANLLSGGVIVGIISLIGNHLSNRSLARLQASLEQKNKRIDADINKKTYISKTRFDTEFSIYRDLTSKFSKVVIDISIMVPYGLTTVPADETARKKQEELNYMAARDSAVEAQNSLHANMAFISKEICEKYDEILRLSRQQLDAYMRRYNLSYGADQRNGSYSSEDFRRTMEIQQKWEEQTERIREYLATLDVIS